MDYTCNFVLLTIFFFTFFLFLTFKLFYADIYIYIYFLSPLATVDLIQTVAFIL